METDYTDLETDYVTEAEATDAPLPTPGGTPYSRTPILSRHASRGPSPSGRAVSPNRRMSTHDGSFDENISILDPRRFTPTLHANLVAEILSLRRELESKGQLVDTLEQDLAAARTEHETATTSAAAAVKEARDIKRQLEKAENEDAVGAVAQERDEAVEALTEMKKQLERLTRARRAAEEDLERIKKIHERDTEKWQDEKRVLERRAHVAEGRLKAVLDEIATTEYATPMSPPPLAHHPGHQRVLSEDYSIKDFGQSDTASIRSSMKGRPMSLLMGDDEAERLGISLNSSGGLSLADELDFDESEGEEERPVMAPEGPSAQTDAGAEDLVPVDLVSDVESVDEPDELPELPELVDMGVQVIPEIDYDEQIHTLEGLLEEKGSELQRTYRILDQKSADIDSIYAELDKSNVRVIELEEKVGGLATRNSKLESDVEEKEQARLYAVEAMEVLRGSDKEREKEHHDRLFVLEQKSSSLDAIVKDVEERTSMLDEREKLLDEKLDVLTAEEAIREELDNKQDSEKPKEGEYEANVCRKRSAGVASSTASSRSQTPTAPLYVSVEAQTVELPSPPQTPEPEVVEGLTTSTGIQTDAVKQPRPSFIHVPAIMVSPPEPTPPLPKPVTKNASAQTRPVRMRTRSMQTEVITIDERLRRFAPHLLPSALLPKTEKPEEVDNTAETTQSPKTKTRNRRSVTAPMPLPTISQASSTSDAGVGSSPMQEAPKRKAPAGAPREPGKQVLETVFSSIDFSPGDDVRSSGEEDFNDEGEESVSEYKTALSAPRPKKERKPNMLNIISPSSVPEMNLERYTTSLKRQPTLRKSAMVSSGVSAHARRRRSPSLGSSRTSESGSTSLKIGPPFPVPTRHSSRRPGYLSDRDKDRSGSPSPRATRNGTRRYGRPNSIRKVRSAAAIPSSRDGQRSPTVSQSSYPPDSPGLPPPLPKDEISSPAFDRRGFGQSRHKQHASTNTQTTGQHSVSSSVQQTSVVDAIAQTMVGEWMWKYVRRRRSFGVGAESPQGDDTTGGQRHRRWVWLAPYERAVMWSSRQPTSGSALLGKSGRKRKRSILHPFGGGSPDELLSDIRDRVLTKKVLVQSVLDVKDDTPPPKGVSTSQPVFNRSILILTPARALKFTAPTKERHYVWLTALSFLSHSAEGKNDGLLALPPPMPFEYEQMQEQQQQTRHEPPAMPPSVPAKINAFSTTRDSVRLAKGKGRAKNNNRRNAGRFDNLKAVESQQTPSAEPPSVPRYPGYSRRRSSSNARPQTRSTSHGYERSLASYSNSNEGSISGGDIFYGVGGIGLPSGSTGNAGPAWDTLPLGTMRMAAFVDRGEELEEYDDTVSSAAPSSYRLRRDKKPSRQESFWGDARGGFYDDADPGDAFWTDRDPFRGF
jgi:hypothetical protein